MSVAEDYNALVRMLGSQPPAELRRTLTEVIKKRCKKPGHSIARMNLLFHAAHDLGLFGGSLGQQEYTYDPQHQTEKEIDALFWC